jgi:hypothetical protein
MNSASTLPPQSRVIGQEMVADAGLAGQQGNGRGNQSTAEDPIDAQERPRLAHGRTLATGSDRPLLGYRFAT